MADLKSEAVNNEWQASHRYARMSARKVRLIADMIRGMDCNAALDLLRFQHQRGAMFLSAVLKSAMVNADEQEADMNRLFVKESRVDEGPYFRRFRPKDRGRAHPIAKRTCHMIIKVAER